MELHARRFNETSDDLDYLADILGKALFKSPQWIYILPDENDRKKYISSFMKFGLIYSMKNGEVYVLGEPAIGVSVWFPPIQKFNLYDRLKESGIYELKETAGKDVFSRFVSSMEHVEWIKSKLTIPPYYYMMILGIQPEMQGKRNGEKLMQPVMDKANREGLACLLETSIYKTIPFYEKMGFTVAHDTKLINGPPVWILLKHPV